MRNSNIILDASALIAFAYGDKGHAIVAEILPYAVMSSVNVTEVVKHLLANGAPEIEINNLIDKSLEKIITFDRKQAFIAASLFDHTKQFGLSLADRACLALAQDTGFIIYTADKIWSKLNIDGVSVKLIR